VAHAICTWRPEFGFSDILHLGHRTVYTVKQIVSVSNKYKHLCQTWHICDIFETHTTTCKSENEAGGSG